MEKAIAARSRNRILEKKVGGKVVVLVLSVRDYHSKEKETINSI